MTTRYSSPPRISMVLQSYNAVSVTKLANANGLLFLPDFVHIKISWNIPSRERSVCFSTGEDETLITLFLRASMSTRERWYTISDDATRAKATSLEDSKRLNRSLSSPDEQPQSALSPRLAVLDQQTSQAIQRTFFWRRGQTRCVHGMVQERWPRRCAFAPSFFGLRTVRGG